MLSADMGLAALHPSRSNFADITSNLQALKNSLDNGLLSS